MLRMRIYQKYKYIATDDDHGKLELICMRKLEVVHKEVGGYLSMAQIDDHQSVTDQM